MHRLGLLPILAALAGCATSPTATTGRTAEPVAVGLNTAGERCVENRDSAGSAAIYCGTWEQPSARMVSGGPADASSVASLATASGWRSGLEARFACGAPAPTTLLGNQPTVILQCTRRIGGWPQLAMVTVIDGTAWYVDGVNATLPVLPEALAVLTGRSSGGGAARSFAGADALMATRLASQAIKSGDIGEYEHLIAAGTRANLADSPKAAERAFRAALTLQQKALGANNPNTADATMLLALQLSNQGQFGAANSLLERADGLVGRSNDTAASARLLHYRGLHELNQNNGERSLTLLNQAEAQYTLLLPRDVLDGRGSQQVDSGASADLVPNSQLLIDPIVQSSLLGVIEVRRNRAIALKLLGREAEAERSLQSAADLARANNLAQPIVTSRLYRTQGMLGQPSAAIGKLSDSAQSFTLALPGSRSYAVTGLLEAAKLQQAGRGAAAIEVCRTSLQLLRELLAGTDGATLMPCLDAFAAEAARTPGQAQALRGEMFMAAQLAQGGVTSQQIAEASARLLESNRDPKVGEAIRHQQDSVQALGELYRLRTQQAMAKTSDGPTPPVEAALDRRIAAAEQTQQEADSAVQAAAPEYGQLVQQVVPPDQVFAGLHSGEAFASTVLGDDHGWVFLLRDGAVSVARIDAGSGRVTALVGRIRTAIEPGASGGLPAFDSAASQELYSLVLGGVAAPLDGTSSLVVAPSGPLLSIPFAILLTGPAAPDNLSQAPWLIRRMAVAHVPAPANFVSLRKVTGTSRAPNPWFGLGDARPIPLSVARSTLPGPACVRSAELLASLPALPFAGRELDLTRKLLGGSPSDQLVGKDYTLAAIEHAALANYRVLHFASHALLPSELRCEDQAAIVTSAPQNAASAGGVLLTANQIATLKLDADVVILSACNSGGPGGATGGESLSGLARAFFFAGARSLLVTHWSVNDQAAAFIVVDTLRRLRGADAVSLAEALRQSQLTLMAGSGGIAAHPFYWAPFALIGAGQDKPGSAART